MKITTMTLPTGEFVILAGEADENERGLFAALTALRDGTGAASVLFTTQPLTGEDSMTWEGPAMRRDPDPIQHLLDAGANFTPAGLVDHRSLSEIVEQDVLGQDARTPQRGLVAGVQRSPELAKPKPYEPQAGDLVSLSGSSFGGFEVNGKTGTVDRPTTIRHDGRAQTYWWVDTRIDADLTAGRRVLPEQMELINRG